MNDALFNKFKDMMQIMEDADGLGVPVRLRVLKVNVRAAKFFESLGFGSIGETDTHILMERSFWRSRCG